MGKRKRASSSSLFLMELILAILFFCISGTVCISAFARSHIMHTESAELNNAIKTARDVAEVIRSGDTQKDIISSFNKIYGAGADNLSDDLIIYMDSDFMVSSTEDGEYYIYLSPLTVNNVLSCTIDICRFDDMTTAPQRNIIYSLNIERSL